MTSILDRTVHGARQHRLAALVIDSEITPDSWLAKQIRGLGCDVKCSTSVDHYLDGGDRTHRNIVLIDVNIFDPQALSQVVKLRTHFGAGPSTHIIAMTHFFPGAFDTLLEQAGCDLSITKSSQLSQVMAVTSELIERISSSRA